MRKITVSLSALFVASLLAPAAAYSQQTGVLNQHGYTTSADDTGVNDQAVEGVDAEFLPVLQAAVGELEARSKSLSARAGSLDPAAERKLLATTINQGLEDNTRVEQRFEHILGTDHLSAHDAVFFNAVRTRYLEARQDLEESSPHVMPAMLRMHKHFDQSPLDATVAAMTYNADVYRSYQRDIQGLFDLTVVSYPAGARITFWQNGTDNVQYAQAADTTIKALPLSVWTVKAEYPGKQPMVRTLDAMATSDHTMVFNFTTAK